MRDSTCYKLVVTVDGPFSSDDRAARYPSSRRLSFGSMYVTSDFSVFFFFGVESCYSHDEEEEDLDEIDEAPPATPSPSKRP